jgi:predicted RNase H-like HicB family nuclease
MRRTIQVRFFRGDKKYVAECLDLPVVTEANTLDELASNIREAIALHDAPILATMELDAVA